MSKPITPSQRVMLDRRIAEERCEALHPPFERPEWYHDIYDLGAIPNAYVMDQTGAMSRRWVKADEVDWSGAIAIRLETPDGRPLLIENLVAEDEDCY